MRVIAQVLNNGAAVSVPVCLAQFVGRGIWEALEQDRLNVGIPGRVDVPFGYILDGSIRMMAS
jgi:hypothetical protein